MILKLVGLKSTSNVGLNKIYEIGPFLLQLYDTIRTYTYIVHVIIRLLDESKLLILVVTYIAILGKCP